MEHMTAWITPALDVVAIGLLGALLWRLRRDPSAAWQAHEARLRELFASLRVLAAQSEGVARDLDGALGAHETRLRALLADATDAVRRAAESSPEQRAVEHDDVIARVRRLAAAATPIEEIARRVDMPAAEIRVLVGLHGGRSATRSSMPEPTRRPRASEARA